MSKKIGFTLPDEIYEKIEKVSKESGIAKSNMIKILVQKYLDKEFRKEI